ncbi:hypothetical protein DL93DRAFT_1666074 [Clavulina sp. PMI_390]|nr:hypothetical protein DL93DRAFT_1666074 [Clavulina sp. PMI_390]
MRGKLAEQHTTTLLLVWLLQAAQSRPRSLSQPKRGENHRISELWRHVILPSLHCMADPKTTPLERSHLIGCNRRRPWRNIAGRQTNYYKWRHPTWSVISLLGGGGVALMPADRNRSTSSLSRWPEPIPARCDRLLRWKPMSWRSGPPPPQTSKKECGGCVVIE